LKIFGSEECRNYNVDDQRSNRLAVDSSHSSQYLQKYIF